MSRRRRRVVAALVLITMAAFGYQTWLIYRAPEACRVVLTLP